MLPVLNCETRIQESQIPRDLILVEKGGGGVVVGWRSLLVINVTKYYCRDYNLHKKVDTGGVCQNITACVNILT